METDKKKTGYRSRWQEQLQGITEKILNREHFSYDLNGDALYQQYKDRYIQQGRQAMMDTMGQDEEDFEKDLKALEALAASYGVELSRGEQWEYHAPADYGLPAFDTVARCIGEVFPDVPVIPSSA